MSTKSHVTPNGVAPSEVAMMPTASPVSAVNQEAGTPVPAPTAVSVPLAPPPTLR